MGAELIQGQSLIESFAVFLPTSSAKIVSSVSAQGEHRSGAMTVAELPESLRSFISVMCGNGNLADRNFAKLFAGDRSDYGNDKSRADAGLIRSLADDGFTADECDMAMRASSLMREKWDSPGGDSTYGADTITKVFAGISEKPGKTGEADKPNAAPLFNLDDGRVNFIAGGMPGREFAGPEIAPGRRLFPMKALSCVVALGAAGKTTTVMSIAAAVAAGRDWNNRPTKKAGVILLCVEETQEEISRKISAILSGWPEADRNECLKNLLVISCVGKDARLTVIDYGAHRETSVPSDVIALVKAHEERCGLPVSMVCFDHLQGFTSGDLNSSETAVTLARAGNRIVSETGAAVVLTAHISKANIGAEELSAGFTVGSLAFENAMRQVVGMIPMTRDVAKTYGLEDDRTSYSWLGLIKNSYAAEEDGCWIHKRLVPEYHTVVAEPLTLVTPSRTPIKPANEALAERIISYVAANPWTTRNHIDTRLAGTDGPFKAAQGKIRDMLKALLDDGTLILHSTTAEECSAQGVGSKAKQVLRLSSGG